MEVLGALQNEAVGTNIGGPIAASPVGATTVRSNNTNHCEIAVVTRFTIEGKTQQEHDAALQLSGAIHTYERVGHDCRAMAFLPDGSIGLGQAGRELFWDIRTIDGQLTLYICSDSDVTCRLQPDSAGVWRGAWLHAEQMPIAVYPAMQVIHCQDINRPIEAQSRATIRRGYHAVKVSTGGLYTHDYEVRVFGQAGGHFESVSDSNVLIYFRHGFGDWAQFSCVIPLLESTNRYWIARFGDDYTSVMEGSDYVTPVYLGMNSIHCDDGGAYDVKNFSIDGGYRDGSVRRLNLPTSLYDLCVRERIDAVLQVFYPETWGDNPFPYHTKARHTLRELVNQERLPLGTLHRPLGTAINFHTDNNLKHWIEVRLQNITGFGYRKMCLISRNGYTAIGKNWGHMWREDLPENHRREGEEVRDFMRLMLKKDPRWMFLIMEDRLFDGDDTLRSQELHAYSYAELFGSSGPATVPFGRIMKILVSLSDLSVGVPTGPYHLSMLCRELPTVGVWIEHLPSWYDEPKDASVHVISRNVRDCGMDRRPGSFFSQSGISFRSLELDSRVVPGERVIDAVEMLL